MIGWQLDKFCEYEAARFDRLDGLVRRHPQVSLWSPGLAQDCGFLARPLMPVDDGNIERTRNALKLIFSKYCMPKSG
jgi:hypothetical protein